MGEYAIEHHVARCEIIHDRDRPTRRQRIGEFGEPEGNVLLGNETQNPVQGDEIRARGDWIVKNIGGQEFYLRTFGGDGAARSIVELGERVAEIESANR